MSIQNQPPRYTHSKSPLERMPKLMAIMFCMGNAIKYPSRLGMKQTETWAEEFHKAQHYNQILAGYGINNLRDIEAIQHLCSLYERYDFSDPEVMKKLQLALEAEDADTKTVAPMPYKQSLTEAITKTMTAQGQERMYRTLPSGCEIGDDYEQLAFGDITQTGDEWYDDVESLCWKVATIAGNCINNRSAVYRRKRKPTGPIINS